MRRLVLHGVETNERLVRHPHFPPHLFRPGAVYFLTSKTLYGVRVLEPPARRQQTVDALSHSAEGRGWRRVAWVVLPNHYHFLLKAPDHEADTLPALVRATHRYLARCWNEEDGTPGRKIWYNYRDTCITQVSSFMARVNYIHWNPVKHGLVSSPEHYPYSSYGWWQSMESVDVPEIEEAYPWDRLDLE